MNAETPRGNGADPVPVDGRFAFTKHTGDIDLFEISEGSNNPRYEVYLSGWSAGFQSQQDRIDRLTWERNLWFFVANNKGARPGDFFTHLTNKLWEEGAS